MQHEEQLNNQLKKILEKQGFLSPRLSLLRPLSLSFVRVTHWLTLRGDARNAKKDTSEELTYRIWQP
jgi:hypothetical protein